MGAMSFLGVKWPGRGVEHPPTSSAEVKEKVELCLYSPSGLSWPVLGWTLHLLPDVSKYCVLSEEPIAVRKNTQQSVGIYMIWGPEQWGRLRPGFCKDFISATVQDITYPWQSVCSDKYVFYVSDWSTRSKWFQFIWNRNTPCTTFYDNNVCPLLHSLDNELWIGDLSRCGCKKIIQEGTLK